ncbi:DNA helicase UvrD [Candidatus Pacearchaeota archaeon]|nr:DNA helicase UvrD [Candidatus Pacearchaeota archaeon]
MEIIADLQIHSKHARATSKDLSFENLEKFGRIKGVNLFGVGDFQHPEHRKEISRKLKEDDKGILRTKTGFPFLWQTEVSLMYSEDGKRRAVHLLIFAPNGIIADKIISYLGSKGRLDYDGRPIFGIQCKDLVRDLKDIDDKIEIIPAHVCTPWFGLFGSKSGFDSLKECFGDQMKHIYAIESGMSADPSMLWRFEEIASGKARVVSFSDAHSFWPWRIGREATIFDIPELSYDNIIKAIRTGEGLKGTIETPPEYGRYHWDGHRNCNFSCGSEETKKLNGKCPKCGGNLIIGVEYRVEELAKKPKGFKPKNAAEFHKLLPLHELIVLYNNTGINSKGNWEIYNSLIEKFENEFNILLKVSKEELVEKEIKPKLIDLIMRNREDKIKIKPGYDGEYGVALLEEQKKLF